MRAVKITALSLVGAILLVGIVRMVYVNVTFEDTPVEIYGMNEVVEYERDYFYYSEFENRNSEGYTISVTDAEIETFDEYVSSHNIDESRIERLYANVTKPEYIIELSVSVSADENIWQDPGGKTAAGISLYDTCVVSSATMFTVDLTLLGEVNKSIASTGGIALRPGTSMDFQLPFYSDVLLDMHGAEYVRKYLDDSDWYLLISMYPTKKMIQLEF